MEKSIILLLCIQYVAKISRSFHYTPKNKQTAVFIEWDEFPKGGSPEFYFLKYQLVNNFAQKVRHLLFYGSDKSEHSKSVITKCLIINRNLIAIAISYLILLIYIILAFYELSLITRSE